MNLVAKLFINIMFHSPLYGKQNPLPAIPRFKQMSQSEKMGDMGSVRGEIKQVIGGSEIGKRTTEAVMTHQNIGINDQKQNLFPIIFQQKIEVMHLQKTVVKRPLTAYEMNCQEPALPSRGNVQIAEFNLDDFLIDAYCNKMSRSIILNEQSPEHSESPKESEMKKSMSEREFVRLRRLGAGKYGEVFLVAHKMTGFVCALKVIDKSVIREEKMEGQISRELRIHSNLRCMNIIEFYGFFEDPDKLYILIEYAIEGSVYDRLKGNCRLDQDVVKPIAKGLCDGLNFIHSMGYVHRDIKPQNVLLQFGIPKICDFGWASMCTGSLCRSYCGTPLYISPEMVRREEYGHSVDVWAMGLVVYQLIVGRVPFKIWTDRDIQEILEKEVEFPEYVDRTFECESFVRACLEKNLCMRMDIQAAQRHQFLKGRKQCNLEYEFFELTRQCLEQRVSESND